MRRHVPGPEFIALHSASADLPECTPIKMDASLIDVCFDREGVRWSTMMAGFDEHVHRLRAAGFV